MKVSEVMTGQVVTCSQTDTVESIIKLMSEKDIGGIPVVDGNTVVGIVTESDVMKLLAVPERSTTLWLPSPLEVILEIPFKEYLQIRDLKKSFTDIGEKPVSDIMSRDVRSISPDSDIEDAASFMMRHKVKRLPVIKDGMLIGIITRDDIIHGLGGKINK